MFFTFRVLKDLQDWKEAPLDSLVLSLYQLQAFYLNETKRGLAGLGNYNVAQKYHAVCLDQIAVQYLPTNSPEEIVKRIREGERNGEIPQVKVKKESEDQQPQEKQMRTLSAHARAQLVLQNDNISFDTKLHVFNVKGISGVTRVVTLFPRPSCSCPSTGECYQADYGYVGVYQASKKEPDPTPEEHKEQKRQEKWQEKATTKGCGA